MAMSNILKLWQGAFIDRDANQILSGSIRKKIKRDSRIG